jgi:hypothetical protein
MSRCSKSLHVRLVSPTGIVITTLARVGGEGDIDLKAINCRYEYIVYKCVAIPSGWLCSTGSRAIEVAWLSKAKHDMPEFFLQFAPGPLS